MAGFVGVAAQLQCTAQLKFHPKHSWLSRPGCPSLRFAFGKRLSSHSRCCPFSASALSISPLSIQECKDHQWFCGPLAGNHNQWWGTERPAGPSAAWAAVLPMTQSYVERDVLYVQPSQANMTFRGLYFIFCWL